jgi:hypothetical protein
LNTITQQENPGEKPMLRFLIFILLLYIAYKFLKLLAQYKRKVDELEAELKKRKIDQLKDTDYEEIK